MNKEIKKEGQEIGVKEERTIDLMQVLLILKRFAAFIIAITLVAAIIGFVYTRYFVEPVYSASFEVLVNAGNGTLNDESNGYVNVSSISSSQKFITMISRVLTSQSFLEPIYDIVQENGKYDLGEDSTYKTLAGMLVLKSGNDIQNLSVSVQSTDKEFSVYLLNLVYDRLPDEVNKAAKGSTVYTLEAPVDNINNVKRVNTNLMRNTAIGALIGFVLSAGAFVLFSFLDTRIKTDADVERLLEVPVIGRIPPFEGHGGDKKDGKENK